MQNAFRFFIPFFLVISACSNPASKEAPHLVTDLTSREYQKQLELRRLNRGLDISLTALGENESLKFFTELEIEQLQHALAVGERMLKWIDFMNAFRDEETKLRLTTREGGLRGIPIETPSRYSPSIIAARHIENLEQMDEVTRNVLINGAAFTKNPGIDDLDFINIARPIDRNYQTSARWKLISPWLSHYEQRAKLDVRGYYYLEKEIDLEARLNVFHTLPRDEQETLGEHLVKLCFNSSSQRRSCERELERAQTQRSVLALYTKYYNGGRRNWDQFFNIQSSRRDISWTSQIARIPFRKHERQDYTTFVHFNVEEEFQWGPFKLLIDLKESNARGSFPFVTFEPGATPHVKGLGGNHIVMDANMPLGEWGPQWTIRHEFGHVLGLPDCYVEFFDTNVREMINYQLDITDLMCSRAGKMNERIYTELRRVYGQ